MFSHLIVNARLVNEGRVFEADLRVRNGVIAEIGRALGARPDEQVFDAAGRTLLPGMIDDQVHFREPGLTHKGDIGTESRAAIAGGITSYMEMPNTSPWTGSMEMIGQKCARAAQSSLGNYAFYLGATNDNLADVARADEYGVAGIKVFMGASTGNMLVDDPDVLDAIFRDAPCLIATHCEDTPTIHANLARFRERHGEEIPPDAHPDIRSREACLKSTLLAIELAKRHDARLHVLHISTAEELELFAPGPPDGKRITAETCLHFLHFCREDYARKGNLIKCNPALKEASDRAALWQAVNDGRIDVLATDHAPHLLAEKSARYDRAAAGLPLVQYALPLVLERYHDGILDLSRIVEKIAHAPARIFGVRNRGYLREGYQADLVLVDLERGRVVRREDVLSRCGWSPFEGDRFRSTVAATWVNGHLAYRDGQIDDRILGQRLEFAR
ncbi:MAG: dihydroorotase [Xanthomonadales bacterium]|nr:Allantoinase [Xanthomonadales bacterium]MCC6594050.1 dihydroorotase [Xanthomonadales bacterium]MCE7931707.1 dihydroorotase [Xanthomonadales bacterium PRO6]